ncbi:efflux RND transporter periplasmic adaptor subunit [Maribacter sp. ACAM166]|uniref:efflux RND transporter periplasmic adaptor subunit n=1 Tax=Maribacter sp. ACAM166 TaxID=2508996 RepID=UPI0010FE350E|nr:efflux RND transporter periplasmic adaptor subunit [Maribacter sp. ACAM166]TLP81715.1 efflux RND transporter periplasmic adaptor subunit [Maribacter sp. ACAM166]
MKKINYILLLTGVLALAVSCGGNDAKVAAHTTDVVPVQVRTVAKEDRGALLMVSGTVEAVKSSAISTRMMGYMDRIYVNVGDKVRKGQLLLSINNADLSAKLAQVNAGITEASVAFSNAEKDFNRYTTLFNETSASQKELDDISASYNMAKARLESAKQMKNEVNAQFSYANIRAPFNGVVTNKFINAGDMANPGMPLLEVEAPGNFQILAMVPESEISQIKVDTEVDVLVKSLNESVSGKVAEVSTSAKSTGGQYLVKVLLDKTETNLMSGMYATVQFPTGEKAISQAVFVPLEAIVKRGQLSGIYTVSQNNTALLRWLRLGRTFGDRVEVLSGLSPDEQYIIGSQGKLYNGAKISLYVK